MSKRDEDEDEDQVTEGVCTAHGCGCKHFKPRKYSPMYCVQKECGHSVEWHHVNAREIRVG